MIRNAVLHLNGEQPCLVDIFDMPSPGDLGLRCTNLRLMNGKRPVFVDDQHSVFFFPYLNVRFLEIPPAAAAADGSVPMPVTAGATNGEHGPAGADLDADLEIDEDFLRRIREV